MNDFYQSDIEIISKNFETLYKISSIKITNIDCKKGKEMIIKCNMIENLVPNIIFISKHKIINAVLNGLSVVDHLFKIEEEKEVDKYPNLYKDFLSILDNLDGDMRIELSLSRIIKKIVPRDDIIKLLIFLNKQTVCSECKILFI